MNIECKICHDPVKVPVYFTCFPCCQRSNDSIQCNSITRVCLFCAEEYLQLNKPSSRRVASLKCLTCPAYATRYAMNAHPFTKDFMLMSMDDRKNIPCHDGCDFTGNQNELDRHRQSECIFRLFTCECMSVMRMIDKDEHVKTCNKYFFCPFCSEYIKKSIAPRHVGIHGYSLCPECKDAVLSTALTTHQQTKCPMRKVNCPIQECRKNVSHKDWKQHCTEHVKENIRSIEMANNTIKKKTQNLQILQDLLQQV